MGSEGERRDESEDGTREDPLDLAPNPAAAGAGVPLTNPKRARARTHNGRGGGGGSDSRSRKRRQMLNPARIWRWSKGGPRSILKLCALTILFPID